MRSIGFLRLLPRAALALAALLATATAPLSAQTDPAANYPNKPIRMIVRFRRRRRQRHLCAVGRGKASEFLGQHS